MKEQIEQLIEDYKTASKYETKQIAEFEKNNGDYFAVQKMHVKHICYRNFIADLETILKSEQK